MIFLIALASPRIAVHFSTKSKSIKNNNKHCKKCYKCRKSFIKGISQLLPKKLPVIESNSTHWRRALWSRIIKVFLNYERVSTSMWFYWIFIKTSPNCEQFKRLVFWRIKSGSIMSKIRCQGCLILKNAVFILSETPHTSENSYFFKTFLT